MSKFRLPPFAPAAETLSHNNHDVRSQNRSCDRRRGATLLTFILLLLAYPSTVFPQASRWKVYTRENSLLGDNNVIGIGIDSSGYRWIGTMSAGLYKVDGSGWSRYDRSNSAMPGDTVISILIRPDGSRWFGTHGGGLVSYHDDTWEVYNTENCGLKSDNISGNALFLDHDTALWVGTWGGGICRYRDDSWVVFDTSNSPLPDQVVWSGCVDNTGDVWLGTYRGLARYSSGTWDVYTTANSGIPYNDISALCRDNDHDGSVWMGTWGGGIARFDGTNWTIYDSLNSKLPGNYVEALTYDNQGRLWIGSWGSGVAVYDGQSWVVFNSSNSELPSDNIRMLLDDSPNSKMWICSEGGLAVYDYHELSAVPRAVKSEEILRIVQASPTDPPRIDIDLPMSGRATVTLFDVSGKQIATLTDGEMEKGPHSVQVPETPLSGCYNCALQLDGMQIASTAFIVRR